VSSRNPWRRPETLVRRCAGRDEQGGGRCSLARPRPCEEACMNTDLILVLALLGVTIVLFALNRPRMDAVALIMLTALPLTGVITMQEALAGFSDPSIVLIAALFVIGDALVRTGVAQKLGDFLIRRTGRSEVWLISLLMAIVTGIGAFMSSTGVVAIFIPVALRIARSSGIAPGRLMMPMSVADLGRKRVG